jgi:hypothetical protein
MTRYEYIAVAMMLVVFVAWAGLAAFNMIWPL